MPRALRGTLAAILILTLLGACAAGREEIAWRHTLQRDHVLTGRIWSSAEARFIAAGDLYRALSSAHFVLLGERHDNQDHHLLQAATLRALAARGRRPAVAFEMIDLEQADALATFLAAAPKDMSGLGAAIGWARTGWPDWSHYRPIAEAAHAAGLPMRAANLPRARIREAVRGGAASVPEPMRARLALDEPLPVALQTAMEKEIADAHCDMLPVSLLPGMAFAQRLRDAVMADSMLTAPGEGAVLIAGNGHVRSDRGVPMHLAARAPARSVATLAFIEVDAARTRPGDYELPFDFVWFTPRVDDLDPCERMRRARSG
ncbi:MAG: ChaN family lipoprotein [Alphaproteobacteria bacterium]|nr:ChaN family lipoprotein [Alphaproteobacteria bacterium]